VIPLALRVAVLLFVAVAAPAVVLTREPRDQAIVVGFYGLILATMFFLHQAPDVAFSQLVVGAVALPLMIMLTLSKIRRDRERLERRDERGRR